MESLLFTRSAVMPSQFYFQHSKPNGPWGGRIGFLLHPSFRLSWLGLGFPRDQGDAIQEQLSELEPGGFLTVCVD
jgi:hypothetical protein